MKRYRVLLTLKQVNQQYQSYIESFNVKPYADLPTTRAKEAKRQMDSLKRSQEFGFMHKYNKISVMDCDHLGNQILFT
jgi:hypothetical protein